MQQRVFKLGLYKESPEEKLTNQMSDHILHAIESTLGISRDLIKVFTRDGVYLNDLCMLKLCGGQVTNPNTGRLFEMRGIYPDAFNIKCMSHTLDNCGAGYTVRGVKYNRIEGPNAKKIYNQVNGLFSGPGEGPKMAWKASAGTSMPSVSQTRWWSREEFWEYILPYFKCEEPHGDSVWFDDWIYERVNLLKEDKKHVGSHFQKLYDTFVPTSPEYDRAFLVTAFIEVALVVDISKKVREATYVIEGDGPISVMVVEILDSVKRYYDATYEELEFPNLRRHIAHAVALNIPPPGYVAPAVVRIEGEVNAPLEQDIIDPSVRLNTRCHLLAFAAKVEKQLQATVSIQ